jgi:site-specific DNA recombinase
LAELQLSPGWATYLRVSDEDKQSPQRSFAMQRQSIQKQLLLPSTLPLKQEYRDKLTGTSPNRADYQQMLADAKAGLFSHLGLCRADRFGRNAVEGLQAATKLISLGVNLRVANMPSLTPETPDGFFMFLLQMGLAQRKVDVMRQRVLDGMEAKLRAGSWAHKAPEGYVNKERLISSGKYERWVEIDPIAGQGLRKAWDLLLTGRYTLAQICEELTRRGTTRTQGQRPWAWTLAGRQPRFSLLAT